MKNTGTAQRLRSRVISPIARLLTATAPTNTLASALRIRWSTLTVTGWLGIVALTLGLFVASLPARYNDLIHPSAVIRAELAADGLSLIAYANYITALEIVVALGFLLAALAVILLTRGAPRALFVSLTLTTFGAALPGTAFAIIIGRPISDVPVSMLQGLGWFFLLIFAYLFPNGRFTPGWTRYLVPLWAAWVSAFFALAHDVFAHQSLLVGTTFLIWVWWFATGAYAQYRRYIAVDSDAERYQTKWVVLGFFGAIIGALFAALPHIAALSLGRSDLLGVGYQLIAATVISVSGLLIPFTITTGMLRRRLFDVDLIINRALVYGALSATLALVYGVCVVALMGLVAAESGRFSVSAAQHPITLVSATLVVAALAQPLRRRIQRDINRRFYRRRFNMQRILEAFGSELKHEVELEQLCDRLLQTVSRTMQPSHVSLWLAPLDRSQTARVRARLNALDKQLQEDT